MYYAYKSKQTAAFTLVEIVMVLVIALLMMSLALPSFTDILSTNKEKAAVRTIRSMLALAQSRAAANNRNVGIRFQFDGEGWQQGTQYMVLVENTKIDYNYNPPLSQYKTAPDTRAIPLPQGIAVIHSGIVDNMYKLGDLNLYLNDSTSSKVCLNDSLSFCIFFSPSGQVTIEDRYVVTARDNNDKLINVYNFITKSNIGLLASDTLDKGTPLWLNAYNSSSGLYEISAAGLFIAEVDALRQCNPDLRYSGYLKDLKPYLINIYTGQFLPRDE